MDKQAITNELRKRMVTATGIDPLTQLKQQFRTFDTTGKSLFIVETVNNGGIDTMSNQRLKMAAFVVQYDVCVPSGTGISTANAKADLIVNAFNLNDNTKSTIAVGDTTLYLISTEVRENEGENFDVVSVVLSFTICG